MTQTALTKATLPPATFLPPGSVGTAIPLNPCDAVNGNSIISSDDDILVVINSTTGALTFTITGQIDPSGRLANFSMSVPGSFSATLATAGGTTPFVSAIITPKLKSNLWSNTLLAGGLILLPSSNVATLFVGVISGT